MTFRLTPPPAVLAPLVREAPSRLDPFRLDGPALVSFSGGRTSAYMLRRILDACGGRLPAGVHAVFANTGRERAETLAFVRDCAERWGVHIVWIEREGAEGFREVDYERASRNGEPFAELIAERRYLPNAVARFCTSELKVLPLAAWMRAQGHDTWLNVVGLRRDEARRVAKIRARNATGEQAWESVCPLYDARVVKGDVAAFWRAQPFDLALQAHEGNCDACLAGETEVVTADGIKQIRDLAGTTPRLLVPKMLNGGLSEVGSFVEAPVRSFGVQRLWRIELVGHGRSRKVVHATADHRWFVSDGQRRASAGTSEVTTSALRPGMRLRRLFRCPIGADRGDSSRVAALRGFVFGDGCVPQGERPSTVSVYTEPKLAAFGGLLTALFGESHPSSRAPGEMPGVTFYGVPRFWKTEVPSLGESRHYLMGWLAGWFAADGCVSKQGICILNSAFPEHLEFARSVCAVLGVQCSQVRSQTRRVKPPGGEEREHTMYGVNFNRHHLTRDFFWLRHHQEHVEASASAEDRRYGWTVVSVTPTERVEEVFCATVEGVGAFGLSDGLMTGNCFMKGDRVRARIVRERPDLAAWWVEQERLTGGTFVAGDSYAALTERVRRLPLLPVDLDPEMETAIPCACTDRRRVRCRCGARRGQGHALACPVVMERWAA